MPQELFIYFNSCSSKRWGKGVGRAPSPASTLDRYKTKSNTHYNVAKGAELANEVLDGGILLKVPHKECSCGFRMELVQIILIGPDVSIFYLCKYNNMPVTMEHFCNVSTMPHINHDQYSFDRISHICPHPTFPHASPSMYTCNPKTHTHMQIVKQTNCNI